MLVLAVLVWSVLVFRALAESAQNWQKRSIYQLVTDRFATSDGSFPPCDTALRQYCNGTWQGVIAQLDYIQNMGFDAIWISPIVKNIEGNTSLGEAYHGYWAIDQNSLNEHFGTSDALQLLSTTMHERGMFLMIDVVVNHMAADTLPPDYSTFTPLDNSSSFHPFCWITDWTNQTNVEQCWLGSEELPLADVDTENQDIVNFFNDWIADLVVTYGVDGVRIDTVRNIRQSFWPDFVAAAGVFSIGEVLDGDVQYVANYTGVMDSVLDYPTFYPLTRGFNSTSGDLTQLATTVTQAQSAYRLGEFMTGSFLENQDNPRFQSYTTDQALVMNAMAWPFIQDGIPITYYGQEQGYTGANDPYNREALWLSGYDLDKPLVKHVRALNAARKAAIAANDDYLSTALKFLVTTKSSLAVSKPPMLALLTNGGNASTPSWSVPDANYAADEDLIDVLTCNTVKADKDGGVSVEGSGGMPQILLPLSALNASYCEELSSASGTSVSATSGVGGQGGRARAQAPADWVKMVVATLGAAAVLAVVGTGTGVWWGI